MWVRTAVSGLPMTYLKLVSFGAWHSQAPPKLIPCLCHWAVNVFCSLRISKEFPAKVICKPHCNQLGGSNWVREHFFRPDRWWGSLAAGLGSRDQGTPQQMSPVMRCVAGFLLLRDSSRALIFQGCFEEQGCRVLWKGAFCLFVCLFLNYGGKLNCSDPARSWTHVAEIVLQYRLGAWKY